MENYNSLSKIEIENAITPSDLKVAQIIPLAMLFGSAIFLAVTLFLNSNKPVSEYPIEYSEITQTLIYVVLVMAILIYSFIYFFPNIFLTADNLKNQLLNFSSPNSNSELAKALINIDRQFLVLRNALFEGISLFSLVVVFIEMTNSSVQVPDELWFLATPVFIHGLYLTLNFPTKDRLVDRIAGEILSNLKS